jgi:uncharacterized damage-inducible protein DinB
LVLEELWLVNPEIEVYSHQIRSLLERVLACLKGLSEAQLNWRPPIDGANSAFVIAAHTLGNARTWVLGIACGHDMGRDRPAEFRAAGSYAQMAEETEKLSREIEAALSGLDPSALERRVVPSQELWGEGEVREISVRHALIEVVEHASIHLGELHVTRDLALREARA